MKNNFYVTEVIFIFCMFYLVCSGDDVNKDIPTLEQIAAQTASPTIVTQDLVKTALDSAVKIIGNKRTIILQKVYPKNEQVLCMIEWFDPLRAVYRVIFVSRKKLYFFEFNQHEDQPFYRKSVGPPTVYMGRLIKKIKAINGYHGGEMNGEADKRTWMFVTLYANNSPSTLFVTEYPEMDDEKSSKSCTYYTVNACLRDIMVLLQTPYTHKIHE